MGGKLELDHGFNTMQKLTEPSEAKAGGASVLRFLVVEDQEVQRRILVEILSQLGARVILEALDGASALHIIQTRAPPIDIVLVDLAMPTMDGMELIRRLRDAQLPVSVIIVSAYGRSLMASVEAMASAYGISILGAITKPVTTRKLSALIKRYYQKPGTQQPSETVARTFTLEEITEGLENDQFEPFFQPLVEIATHKLKGAEALARWRHPQYGIVLPPAFIPTLEEAQSIDRLTWIMLDKSMNAWHNWHAAGVQGAMHVNLSVQLLEHMQLAHRMTDRVAQRNVHPSNIVLEITETAVTIQVGGSLENLARLRLNGFGLAIDDYGTGNASLQQLARIAFTQLKVDQFFIQSGLTQESSLIILESSFQVAQRLGIDAVAEGVETQAHWDLVSELGCNLAQGDMITAALEADAYLDWARDWNQSIK